MSFKALKQKHGNPHMTHMNQSSFQWDGWANHLKISRASLRFVSEEERRRKN